MTLTRWMQPRERSEAATTVFVLSCVAGLITATFSLLTPDTSGGYLTVCCVTLPVLALVIASSWTLRSVSAPHRYLWSVFPFCAILVMLALNVMTGDGSVAGQVFLLFPVIYAASQLPIPGAAAVTVVATAADAFIAFTLLPAIPAVTDFGYVGATILTCAGALAYAEQRRAVVLQQLQHQAAIDPLTGLVTRRVLDRSARAALAMAGSGHGTALMMLDIDHFKAVNDQYGHIAGDELLIEVAAVLMALSRTDDVISRMGGDEIAVLLPGCTETTAQRRAEQVRSRIRNHPFDLGDGVELSVSVSIGVAHAPTHAVELQQLYAAADSALYEAKRGGRDQVSTSTSIGAREQRSRQVAVS